MGIDILKTIVQADGFLIGLSGVVFAQMLWAINHQQNTIQAELLKKKKRLWGAIQIFYVNALDKKRRDMTIFMALVIGLFMISIALSLSAMARTELSAIEIHVDPDIRNPLLFMILGIAFFVVFIATSKMSLEKLS